jgi:hypothetical protein
MKLLPYLAFLTMLSASVHPQFPFEKYPAIKYEQNVEWIPISLEQNENVACRAATISDLFDSSDGLRIEMVCATPGEIRLYRQSTLTQTFLEPTPYYGSLLEAACVADIDGDGRKDVKFAWFTGGSGLASSIMRVVYLFQYQPGLFTKVSYYTFYSDATRIERDFDGDGRYEIITNDVTNFEGHNYWTFNVYNFNVNKLVNVNDRFDFPVMVQLLNRENFAPTARITRQQRKKFSADHPSELDIQRMSSVVETKFEKQDFGWAAKSTNFFPIGWTRDGTLFAYGSFWYSMMSANSSHIVVAVQDIVNDRVVWDFEKNWEESLSGDTVIYVPGSSDGAWKEIQAVVEQPLSQNKIETRGNSDPVRFPIQNGDELNVEIVEMPEVNSAIPFAVRAVSRNFGVKTIFSSVRDAMNEASVLGYFPSPDGTRIAVIFVVRNAYPPYSPAYHVIGCHREFGFEKTK